MVGGGATEFEQPAGGKRLRPALTVVELDCAFRAHDLTNVVPRDLDSSPAWPLHHRRRPVWRLTKIEWTGKHALERTNIIFGGGGGIGGDTWIFQTGGGVRAIARRRRLNFTGRGGPTVETPSSLSGLPRAHVTRKQYGYFTFHRSGRPGKTTCGIAAVSRIRGCSRCCFSCALHPRRPVIGRASTNVEKKKKTKTRPECAHVIITLVVIIIIVLSTL